MADHWTKEDEERLRPRNRQVLNALRGGQWLDLEFVARFIGLRNASTVASRLRDIKATGKWSYEMRRTHIKGKNEYRLFPVEPENPTQLDLLQDAA